MPPFFMGFIMAMTRRVFRLAKSMDDVMSPPLKKVEGWIGKRVQGGHAPEPYRSRTADWGNANKRARA